MRLACVLLLVLAVAPFASAGLITFSDLDPGLPFYQEAPMPPNYSTGLPPGVIGTWTNWYWKNPEIPDDHTVSTDDHMQAFLSDSSGAISFSQPVIVPELFVYKTDWGAVGDWTITGTLGGQPQWSKTITTASAWISVQDGTGIAIDELSFPAPGLWNHVDDILVTLVPEVPEPAALGLLLAGGLAVLRRRK